MKILSIETSCDETAVSILDISGTADSSLKITPRAEVVVSQLELHRAWGGVVPNIAKREHERALIPVILEALEKADMKKSSDIPVDPEKIATIETILAREPELFALLKEHLAPLASPDIDAIAVTTGPGLEMALWVGTDCARALAVLWGKPLIPVNHMEGHFLSALTKQAYTFPVLGLLVSGGHTELVLSKKILEYQLLGATKDDAVGESFDKVARMLGLPYPGGPEISNMAGRFSELKNSLGIKLPQPMKHSGDLNFSYSGLKTAVLYETQKHPEMKEELVIEIAHTFETSAVAELVDKTRQALLEHTPATLVVGGGVSANKHLQEELQKCIDEEFPGVTLLFPTRFLSGDNATMIGIAGYLRYTEQNLSVNPLQKMNVRGTWPLAS